MSYSSFNNAIPKTDNSIGHVITDDVVKTGRHENVVNILIPLRNKNNIKKGDYIRVPHYSPRGDIENITVTKQLFGVVKSLKFESGSIHSGLNDEPQPEEFGGQQYKYKAEITPITEIMLQDEQLVSQSVSEPPFPTSKVAKVNDKDFLKEGLSIPKDGFYTGDVAVNSERVPSRDNPLSYYLRDSSTSNHEPSIFRHILISGSTGTGKTHNSKNILRQIAKCKEYKVSVPANDNTTNQSHRHRKLNITVLDPENEYVGLGQNPSNMDTVKKKAEKRGIEYGAVDNSNDVEFNVYAPKTKHSSNIRNIGGHAPIEFGIPFEIVKHHHSLMMPSNPPEQTKNFIRQILTQFFNNNNNKQKTYNNFINWVQNQKTKWEEENNESVVNAAVNRVDRKIYNRIFDIGSKQFTDQFARRVFKPGNVSIIPFGHLQGQEKNLIMQAISSYVVHNKISNNPTNLHVKGTPLLLVIDEAHEYLKNKDTTRQQYIIQQFRTVARRGRKDKLGLFLISQDPSDIDDEIRNQLNTKIYLQLNKNVVHDKSVFVPDEYKNEIPRFKVGQMVITQPNVEPVEIRGLDVCLVDH